jgi:hypothetical protein
MVTSAAFTALFASFTATELFPFLELLSRSGSGTSSPTQAVQVLLPLAATLAIYTAVTFVHLRHTAFGAGNRRLSEPITFVLCGAAGVLEFIYFVQPAGAVDDVVGALGRAALEALPASATALFVLGITLVIAHIRVGGEGGGGGAAVPVNVLKKIALGGAAALFIQIAIAALYAKYVPQNPHRAAASAPPRSLSLCLAVWPPA